MEAHALERVLRGETLLLCRHVVVTTKQNHVRLDRHYISHTRSTDQQSLRAHMFHEISANNDDVHLMETTGSGEKCVDIQLAVEMLH